MRFFIAQGLRWTVADNTLTSMAVELAQATHEQRGTFAMGDKAWRRRLPSWETRRAARGLVSDVAMLRHIERRDSLDQVIKQYDIDYLVVSLGKTRLEQRDGCYVVVAPNPDQGRARQPRQSARICQRSTPRALLHAQRRQILVALPTSRDVRLRRQRGSWCEALFLRVWAAPSGSASFPT